MAVQIPESQFVQCKQSPELQCKSQIKASALHMQAESAVQITNQSRCTAHASRKCSTNPQIKQVHCRIPQKVQYKSQIKASALHMQAESAVQIQKLSWCTVAFPRKCSANPKLKQVHCRLPPKVQCKSQIKASALQKLAGSAIQNPENKQVHCTSKPEMQCNPQKPSNRNALTCTNPHPRNISCIPTSKVLPSTHSLSQYAIVTSSCVRSVNSGWRTAV